MSAQDVTPSICFVTMGCPKNEADTAAMQKRVVDAGYCLADNPQDASVVCINTCSFITEATEESLDMIFTIASEEGFVARDAKLVVTGCMPSRYGEELSGSLPEAAAFLPVNQEENIVALIEQLVGKPSHTHAKIGAAADGAQKSQVPVSCYVKISDGCNRFCSFCTIPYIRGRYHSRTLQDIDQEITDLEVQGAKEVVLIGQDTGVWGRDFEEDVDLAYLLDTLANRHPQLWIRVLYLQPEGITNRLLQVFVQHENVCNYLDIPLQHADEHMLHDMNRIGNKEAFIACVEKIRKTLPNCAVRTTLIAGFPGETRQQAKVNANLLEQARFDYAGVFPYSQEEGTKAGEREDQVPLRTRRARAQRLRDLADAISFADMRNRLGQVHEVLVEGIEQIDDGSFELVGRTKFQAPDIDGGVHLPAGSAQIGQIVNVELIDCFCYEYEGHVV